MIILGIDPGYDRLGWGVIKKDGSQLVFIACGVIQTSKNDSHAMRLNQIFHGLSRVIQAHNPSQAVVEKLFFATNAKTAINVAEARGVIILVCEQQSLEIKELTPLQIKSAVTGNGHADKLSVEKMVRLILKNVPDKILDDALDALAAALA